MLNKSDPANMVARRVRLRDRSMADVYFFHDDVPVLMMMLDGLHVAVVGVVVMVVFGSMHRMVIVFVRIHICRLSRDRN